MPNLKDGFGSLLRKARLADGLTQAGVAEKVGVTQPTIYNWESGKTEPTDKQKGRLRDIFASLEGPGKDDEIQPVGLPPFAQWVSQSRKEKGFSVKEVAQKAGLSIPAIYESPH